MASTYSADSNVEVLHEAAAAFRNRDVSYQAILEDLPAAIYTTDAVGRITYFNKACIEFSGRNPAVGDDSWCVTWKLYKLNGEPLRHDQCPMAVALREKKPNRGIEAIAERPDGSRVHFLPYPTPIFDEFGTLLGAVNMLVDLTEQKQMENQLKLMARELDHRNSNIFMVIQSLIRLTKAGSIDDYKDVLTGRIEALANANGLMRADRWTDANLKSLMEEELASLPASRVVIDGEAVDISLIEARGIAMAVHELCTNAVKHGALSNTEGTVRVTWKVASAGDNSLEWIEQGGPPVVEPDRKGVGSSVIEMSVKQIQGRIQMDWQSTGLRCSIRWPRSS